MLLFTSLKTSLNGLPTEMIRPQARADPILPLRLERVCYAVRGQTLLHDLSTLLEEGLSTVVLGPNGAGKSLLLRLCHGLIAPTGGRVLWEGPGATQARRR